MINGVARPRLGASGMGRPLFRWSWYRAGGPSAEGRSRPEQEDQETVVHAPFRNDVEQALRLYGTTILRSAYAYLHNREDAEDVVQDTLLQLMRTDPTFQSPAHEKAWLLRVAINLSKNKLKAKGRQESQELKEDLLWEDDPSGRLSPVWEAVGKLAGPYRAVIHLFYHEGYSTGEIAGILRKKESTVRSLLRRGRLQLKELLREAYDFDE